MRWFRNLELRTKLLVSFGAVVSLIVPLGVCAVTRRAMVDAGAAVIADRWLPSVTAVAAIDAAVEGVRVTQYRHVAAGTPAGRADAERTLREKLATVAELRRRCEPLVADAEGRALYDEFSREWTAYLAEADGVLALSARGAGSHSRGEGAPSAAAIAPAAEKGRERPGRTLAEALVPFDDDEGLTRF